jgi:hypothetical protein
MGSKTGSQSLCPLNVTVFTFIKFYEIYETSQGQAMVRTAEQTGVNYPNGVKISDRSILTFDVKVKSYRIEAVAEAGDEIQELEITIYLSNECTGNQSIGNNDKYGWFKFPKNYEYPMNPDYCPAMGTPSSSPSTISVSVLLSCGGSKQLFVHDTIPHASVV